jgi:hypothetical protein
VEGVEGVEALGFSTVEGVEDVEALGFSTVETSHPLSRRRRGGGES